MDFADETMKKIAILNQELFFREQIIEGLKATINNFELNIKSSDEEIRLKKKKQEFKAISNPWRNLFDNLNKEIKNKSSNKGLQINKLKQEKQDYQSIIDKLNLENEIKTQYSFKHQNNETNLLYELDKLRQENENYKSNLTKLKQEREKNKDIKQLNKKENDDIIEEELSLVMGSNSSNQDSLEFGIEKFIIDSKALLYAEIFEHLSNTYNEQLPKGCNLSETKYKKVKSLIQILLTLEEKNCIGLDFKSSKNENEVITTLIRNTYHIVEEKPIDYNILDLYDTAIYFKNTLNIKGGLFYDRHITMNIPSLLLQNYSIRTIQVIEKILQTAQTVLLIFGPFGRNCLLYLIQNSQFLEYIPTFEEILGFTTEAKRYFTSQLDNIIQEKQLYIDVSGLLSKKSSLHEQEISSQVVSEKGSANERKYDANVPHDVHTCVEDD
ncbi:17807_t:CDS:2 [Racocetra persica]|uniref:17807_t:CDS:1 n=1 Tax=Racocetra persica TaxID=160502 RepID=A0ACA9K9A4_9GLOM|nr:17807_t:CDS:2 [Racocetra persica]